MLTIINHQINPWLKVTQQGSAGNFWKNALFEPIWHRLDEKGDRDLYSRYGVLRYNAACYSHVRLPRLVAVEKFYSSFTNTQSKSFPTT